MTLADTGGDTFSVGGNASLSGSTIAVGAAGAVHFGTLTVNSTGAANITESDSTTLAGPAWRAA